MAFGWLYSYQIGLIYTTMFSAMGRQPLGFDVKAKKKGKKKTKSESDYCPNLVKMFEYKIINYLVISFKNLPWL